ncbi:uncharacterized protein BYT42DRAFT_554524 [Radiomyces spectabilis]|uniref:uncharacterized protein n=1 Tax=Radiomyces spectabilis TaxID=64574 RepID=UPI00221E998E|nr:uncharacterized protein BYT42DRAFT_554524 [Radiomyces spectabilis]KAI8390845.1 hypothetical protein BYT42DRAFT_554524 [Radiomyces spectabilis]
MEQQVMTAALPMLILGLGWTGQFLVQLLTELHLNYAATTRDGRNDTIKWEMPLDSCSDVDASSLPAARTVLITFPVMNPECVRSLIREYEKLHGASQWILLSSTRPFTEIPSDRHSPLDPSKDTGRMGAETVIIQHGGTVLHLGGLWGAQRQPRNWVPRFATESALRTKLLNRPLHLIHGQDVARAIVAVHEKFQRGERWIITDGGCYDWIRLFLAWGSDEQIALARDLARNDAQCREALGEGTLEEVVQRGGVRPRLDSREFWETFKLTATQFLDIK